jgi:hypothetical protein
VGKPATLLYPSSSIRRSRRTKAEMENIREAIYQVTLEDPPMTVRQVFYQPVSRDNMLPRGSRFIQGAAPGGFRALGPVMVVPLVLPGIVVPISCPGVTVDVVLRAELFPMSTPGFSGWVTLPPMLVPAGPPRVACCPPAPGPASISRGSKEHRCEYAQE